MSWTAVMLIGLAMIRPQPSRRRTVFTPMRLALMLMLLVFTPLTVHAQEYFPPPDSDGGWRTLKDPAQIRDLAGMDAQRLQQAFDFTQRCTQNGGLLVV